MASVTIPAATARLLASPDLQYVRVGEVATGNDLVPGSLVYIDGTQLKRAVRTSAAAAKVVGVCMATAKAGQMAPYLTAGGTLKVTAATFDAGATYWLHEVTATAGKVYELFTDLTTGDHMNLVGYATSTTELFLMCKYLGVAA